MNQTAVKSRARWTLATIFTVFLTLNVAILSMAAIAAFHGDWDRLPPHIGADTPMGVRLGILAVILLASWFFARALYRLLVGEEVLPSESLSPAYGLLSYLVLVGAAYCFLGYGTWLWLPVFFLLVLIWTLLALWSLVGSRAMLGGLCIALLTVIVIIFLFN
ncbi:MAG TPA: hypothetical protein VJW20_01965 [Candidatus Angelobacter sp.]|nr:hypothetical protein [Candidatus Angelobacter sp.]